jgi:hypothetical protein
MEKFKLRRDKNIKWNAPSTLLESILMTEDYEKPIKMCYTDDPRFEYDKNGDPIISRKATLSEICAAFGVDEVDIPNFEIGVYKLSDEENT